MPVNKKLYAKLIAEHGDRLRAATTRRDPTEANKILKQLPDLDVAGNTTTIIIPKKRR